MVREPRGPVVGVSVALWHDGKVLLVRRARPPHAGLWSFPGGKVEHGETLAVAALRELGEETGLSARIGEVIATLDVIEPPGSTPAAERYHFVLVVLDASAPMGMLVASDDAAEAGWFSLDQAEALHVTPEPATLLARHRRGAARV